MKRWLLYLWKRVTFVSRARYEADLTICDLRLKDLERHFVTRRNEKGEVTETLADVPLAERRAREAAKPHRVVSWPQRRAWLEATDGGRNVPARKGS